MNAQGRRKHGAVVRAYKRGETREQDVLVGTWFTYKHRAQATLRKICRLRIADYIHWTDKDYNDGKR